ncbi:MAG: hypothetical protein JW814_03065 [Candidatus Krumholzibacteriota bacterium]|nr:hypothetical protein [Candidatus Krumholzibacteriota bacterium]
MFLTQEKALKRIQQDRLKGDLKKAFQRSVDALSKWPDDFDLAIEAIQLSFDISDFKQSVSLMKGAIRHHPKARNQIIEMARETLQRNFNPFLASFIIEMLLRSKNIERIREMLRLFSEDFIQSLVKRSETRSKGLREESQGKGSQYTDNELLLGLLHMAAGRFREAAAPLARALDNSPEDAELFGILFIEIERAYPDHAFVKFQLGKISILLSHPEKAEPRFFQAIELDDPPLDELLLLLGSSESQSENHLLLLGEILIRSGSDDEGERRIKEYIEKTQEGWNIESASDRIKQLFPDRTDSRLFAFDRLSHLPEKYYGNKKIVFLLCEIAEDLGRTKEAVEQMEILFDLDRDSCGDIVRWIEERDDVKNTAPSQRLLARLYIHLENFSQASSAAILSAEMDPALISSLLDIIEEGIESSGDNSTELLAAKVELHALSGNSEKAEQLIGSLEGNDQFSSEDLFRLTGKIIEKSGSNLDRIISILELGLRKEDVSGATAFILEFYRNNPDAHDELRLRIETLLPEDDGNWEEMVKIIDLISETEDLSKPFRVLRAKADLRTGRIEKAIFEFDQLMMFGDSAGLDLESEYEKAAVRDPGNTTLNLALYQLHLDNGLLLKAAHYLCKSLESDPGQIKDVIERFDRLVEKEPGNREIWEELLRSALNVNHVDLAKEILRRAIARLPKEETAALHVYGARISMADGKAVDSLRCLAMALTGKEVDLRSILEELSRIIDKDPGNPEARYLVADTLLRMGKENEAMIELEKCLELSQGYSTKIRTRLEELLPLSIKPWLFSKLLGLIAWKEQRMEDAYRYFNGAQNGPVEFLRALDQTIKNIREESPDNRRLTSIYGRSLALQGKYDESADLLFQLFKEDETTSSRIMEIVLEILSRDPVEFHACRLSARINIAIGEKEKALVSVLNILNSDSTDLDRKKDAATEFLEHFDLDVSFIIHYAALKSELGDYDESLARYREALNIDRSAWQEILTSFDATRWPDSVFAAAQIHRAECLLEGGKSAEAFAALEKINGHTDDILQKMTEKTFDIIDQDKRPEYYLFGSRLLVEARRPEKAEDLVREGCALFDVKNATDLLISLAGFFEDSGHSKEAARIFSEVLGDCGERETILRRIETILTGSARAEISRGLSLLKEGEVDDKNLERLSRTALDLGDFGSALKFIRRSSIPEPERKILLAKTYLYMDKPVMALSLAGSISRLEKWPDPAAAELLHIVGVASERVGDFGRAATAFAKLIGQDEASDLNRERAEKNYARFLESQFEHKVELLEKTGDLSPVPDERNLS